MWKQTAVRSSIVVAGILLQVGGSYALWHVTPLKHHTARNAAVASTNTGTPQQTTATTTSPQTITPNPQSGSTNTIYGQNSGSSQTQPQVAGDSTTAQDPAKLLDPTTFGQYDKYKNDTSAYFIDLQPGTGDAIANGKQAAVYYRGWLTNGQLFDQSRAGSDGKLQAFTFTEGQHQVITGWEQALAGMKSGGVRLLIIPPSVGYGAAGQGSIPGNSVLIFQVQLVAVQ